jgi:STE24 endopeptidase
MPTLTLSFLVALAAMVAVRWWLATRQLGALARHRGEVPGAFAATISTEDHARAADYTAEKLRLSRLELLLDAAVLWAVTLGGGFAWLDATVGRLGLGPVWTGVATLLLLMLLTAAVGLPLDVYRTFRIEARYGFNRTGPGLYVADLLRSLALGLALGVPLVALLLVLMRAAGSLWWLYAWAAWVAFGLGLSFLWPRFIAPLFNTFRPLEPGPLMEAVERVMTRCGYSSEGVSVMDGSRRSSHGNAYFTGFGRHKRIVLFDTLVERLEPAEVEAVLAHELGHYRLHHIRQRLALSFVAALVGFAMLGLAAGRPEFYAAFGVPAPSAHAALALFALVVPVYTFWLSPLGSWWSRRHEYQADGFARTHASGASLASALVKLYRDNASTLTPDPLYSGWHDSHPPALARIAALQRST